MSRRAGSSCCRGTSTSRRAPRSSSTSSVHVPARIVELAQRCLTTSTGSNAVDHRRRQHHVDVTPGRPSTTRVTILTGRRMTDLVLPRLRRRDLHRRDRVGVGRTARGHARGCDGGLRLLRAGRVGVRAPGRAAAEGNGVARRRRSGRRVVVDVGVGEPHRAVPAAGRGRDRCDRRARRVTGVRSHGAESLCRRGHSGGPWRSWFRCVAWCDRAELVVDAGARPAGPRPAGRRLVAKNRYRNVDMAESLLVAALPVLAGAAALAVPLPGASTRWCAADRGCGRGCAAVGAGDAGWAVQGRNWRPSWR